MIGFVELKRNLNRVHVDCIISVVRIFLVNILSIKAFVNFTLKISRKIKAELQFDDFQVGFLSRRQKETTVRFYLAIGFRSILYSLNLGM